jgi:hypothetical protein
LSSKRLLPETETNGVCNILSPRLQLHKMIVTLVEIASSREIHARNEKVQTGAMAASEGLPLG